MVRFRQRVLSPVGGLIALGVILAAWVGVRLPVDRGDGGETGLKLERVRGFPAATETSTLRRSGLEAIPDGLWMKFPSSRRAVFHLSSAQDTAVFALATGCQGRTASGGWSTLFEEPRNQIYRLRAGVPQDVCVEVPDDAEWRAFVRYGREMRGPSLWKAQLREAWLTRSFRNWDGKAWGGGRWSGSFELVSEVIGE